MARLESYNDRKKSNHSLPKLKNVVKKLQKSLTLSRRLSLSSGSSSQSSWGTCYRDNKVFEDNRYEDVLEDVKEGYFMMIASEGEEPKRFVIQIMYLADPKFVMMLEEAAEEYVSTTWAYCRFLANLGPRKDPNKLLAETPKFDCPSPKQNPQCSIERLSLSFSRMSGSLNYNRIYRNNSSLVKLR